MLKGAGRTEAERLKCTEKKGKNAGKGAKTFRDRIWGEAR